MGNTTWSAKAHQAFQKTYQHQTVNQVFTQNTARVIANEMSAHGVKIRESRDSDNHPTSLAIIAMLDITGSMGTIPEHIVRKSLPGLMDTMIKNGIEHPQVLFGAIGDQYTDKAKIQVSQFESGADELNKWLTKVWLEGNGGGQGKESYQLAWLFAARHTSIDCWEKRNEKGILFTIGDEGTWDKVTSDEIKSIFGVSEAQDVTTKELLDEALRTYEVYHIHVQQGTYTNDSTIIDSWRKLLGERLILLEDYTAISEVMASIVGVLHGVALTQLTSDMDSVTAGIVSKALVNVKTDLAVGQKAGIIKP